MSQNDGRTSRRSEPAAGPTAATRARIDEMFAMAVARHQAGAIAEAEQLYRQVLALDANHTNSLHNRGLIALQRGDAETAVGLIGQAIAADDRVAEFHYNTALALRALARTSEAAIALERAIALRSDYPPALLNLGNIRREQGDLAAAIACYERALAGAPDFADARFNLANVLSEQGHWDAAVACYLQVLASNPNHAQTHNNLGAALLAQGNAAEAIRHIERALTLKPDLFEAYGNLGRAYQSAGQLIQALAAARRALELRETPAGKDFFAQCAKYARFVADDEGYRQLLVRALTEGWARPGELVRACISLVMLNPAFSETLMRANAAWPALLPAQELFGPNGMAGIASDRLLCRLMESAPITDIGVERLLTNVRSALLASAETADAAPDEQQIEFYCALARQCFVNQYLYALREDEVERAARLRDALAEALDAGDPVPALWPVAVGAYFPLHDLPNTAALLAQTWPTAVGDLVVQQVKEPQEEQGYRASMPALTVIEDDVSREVRQQYEENPYPRWVKAGAPASQPVVFTGLKPGQVLDILIAGCGTGQYAIEYARQTPNGRFLAIDLSLASLGYATRMARQAGLTNLEFAQADILALTKIGRTFDVIEAGGVLHHMADPWSGWRLLLSLLRPGGVMQVGLYSALARQNVAAARALIAQRGYRPIPQDIRRCREELAAAEDGTLLKSLTRWPDFFTMSECRDLLFHSHEHRLGLPQIKEFIAANNLHFAGFLLDAPIEQKFSTRFPGQAMLADLDRWDTYETENPATFAKMYQFWVQKPGADGVTAKLQ